MQADDSTYKLIESREGRVLHPYRDNTGKPTIGIGSTRYENGAYVQMTDPPITNERADALLRWEVGHAVSAINAMLPGIQLSQVRFNMLLDISYNIGIPGLHGSTLLKLIKVNQNDPHIREAFLAWCKDHRDGVLVLDNGLLQRRKWEADNWFAHP